MRCDCKGSGEDFRISSEWSSFRVCADAGWRTGVSAPHASAPLTQIFFYFIDFVSAWAACAARMYDVPASTTYSFSYHRKGQPSFSSGKSGLRMTTPGIMAPGMKV